MNENEFEHDGRVYVAVDAPINSLGKVGCGECVFKEDELCRKPRCFSFERSDRRDVIFVEKQQ